MSGLVIDLCCGLGGWADGLLPLGYTVVGYDREPMPGYPGHFVQADVRTLTGDRFRHAVLIVASPPCEEFSRHSMPWTRKRNPPPPDLSIVKACYRIAEEAGVPLVLENVRAAQPWLGKAEWRYGSCYLWGDGIPLLRPDAVPLGNGKARRTSTARQQRAKVPLALAQFIGAR